MKTISVLTQITLTAAFIISNLTTTLAADKPTHLNIEPTFNKIEKQASTIKAPKTDSYLMVMQQQVEKGDISITYAFYMDQVFNMHKVNQINSDLQINIQFTENNPKN